MQQLVPALVHNWSCHTGSQELPVAIGGCYYLWIIISCYLSSVIYFYEQLINRCWFFCLSHCDILCAAHNYVDLVDQDQHVVLILLTKTNICCINFCWPRSIQNSIHINTVHTCSILILLTKASVASGGPTTSTSDSLLHVHITTEYIVVQYYNSCTLVVSIYASLNKQNS